MNTQDPIDAAAEAIQSYLAPHAPVSMAEATAIERETQAFAGIIRAHLAPLLAAAEAERDTALARAAAAESKLAEIAAALKVTADRRYCDAISMARTTPCLGWEQKVKDGSFGKAEMDAHAKMNHLFGEHAGMHEAIAALAAAPTPPAPDFDALLPHNMDYYACPAGMWWTAFELNKNGWVTFDGRTALHPDERKRGDGLIRQNPRLTRAEAIAHLRKGAI